MSKSCYWAQEHISIDQYGKFRPCCTWQGHKHEDPHLNFNESTIQEYLDSEFKRNLNTRLNNDEWPGGCDVCERVETNNTTSIRQERVRLIRDMEIKFGNLCNLGCYMCTADKSSLLHTTYNAMIEAGIGDERIATEVRDFDKKFNKYPVQWYDRPEKIKELAQYAATRERLRFTGGEPTVNTYLKDFLEELRKHNTDIVIRITTNGMSMSPSLFNLLKEFKKVQITFSIDGIGEYNEYMRWPSNWDKIQRNFNKVLELPNLMEIEINTVVSYLSTHVIDGVIEWGLETGKIYRHAFLPVHYPNILAPNLSADWQKEKFEETYAKYNHHKHIELDKCANFVRKERDDNRLENTHDFLNRLDKQRGTDWRKTFGM
jgi:sulfatase maturation enzyme AslB (radical SAM superfamily)